MPEPNESGTGLPAARAFQELIENAPGISFLQFLDDDQRWVYVSPQTSRILGCAPEDWTSHPQHWLGHVHPRDRESALAARLLFRETSEPTLLEYRMISHDGRMVWIRESTSILAPDPGERPRLRQGFLEDVTSYKQAGLPQAAQSEALALVASGTPLGEVLDSLIRSLEAVVADTLASVLLVGADGLHVTQAAGPSLPEEYRRTLSDLGTWPGVDPLIDPVEGPVPHVIADIATDPSAVIFRESALRHGIRACWWLPVIGFSKQVLGALVMHGSKPGAPMQDEVELAHHVSQVVAFAIQHDIFAKRLQESERRYRALVEEIPVVTYTEVAGAEGAFYYMSPQIGAWSGHSAEEWMGDPSTWPRLIHPEDRERVLAASERADVTGEPFQQEYRLGREDGTWRWVRDEAVMVSRGASEPQTWHGVLSDIVERKLAEERLRDAEQRYRTLVEQIPAVTYISENAEGYPLLYISPQVRDMLGYSQSEYLGNPLLWEQQMHPEDFDRALAEFERGLATGRPFSTEYRMFRADGECIWVRDECVYLDVGSKAATHIQGVIFDVTARKRAEERLSRSLERLRRTDAERRRLMKGLVSAQEEERRRIAGDIHDDAVQKIVALAMRLEQFAMQHPEFNDDAMFKALHATAAKSIASLRSLMFEIRPYALDRSGLGDALRYYVDELRKRPEAPTYVLSDDLRTEPPSETRVVLFRIAQEALTNALVHGRASRVEVFLQEKDGGFLVRIVDDGVGFDSTRLQESVPGHLGLTSMRERAEMAQGWWRIESVPGEGATVEYWLPGSGSADQIAS